MSTRDENWKLQEDDANELGEHTANLINSMDQRKASKWLRRLEKWQPGLALMFSVVAITQPRIAHTRALRQQGTKPSGNLPEEKPRATEPRQPVRPPPTASPQTPDVSIDIGIREGVEFGDARPIDRNVGLPGFSGGSVSREMGAELFRKDDGPEV